MCLGGAVCSLSEWFGCWVLFSAEARNCVPLMSRCVLTCRTLVSACRCLMGVDCVVPVMVLSALFCIFCSLTVCVGEIAEAHAGLA